MFFMLARELIYYETIFRAQVEKKVLKPETYGMSHIIYNNLKSFYENFKKMAKPSNVRNFGHDFMKWNKTDCLCNKVSQPLVNLACQLWQRDVKSDMLFMQSLVNIGHSSM